MSTNLFKNIRSQLDTLFLTPNKSGVTLITGKLYDIINNNLPYTNLPIKRHAFITYVRNIHSQINNSTIDIDWVYKFTAVTKYNKTVVTPGLIELVSKYNSISSDSRSLEPSAELGAVFDKMGNWVEKIYHILVKDTGIIINKGGTNGGALGPPNDEEDNEGDFNCPICSLIVIGHDPGSDIEPGSNDGVLCDHGGLVRHPAVFHRSCLVPWWGPDSPHRNITCPYCNVRLDHGIIDEILQRDPLSTQQLQTWYDNNNRVRSAMELFWTRYGSTIMYIMGVVIWCCVSYQYPVAGVTVVLGGITYKYPRMVGRAVCIILVMFAFLLVICLVIAILQAIFNRERENTIDIDWDFPDIGNIFREGGVCDF